MEGEKGMREEQGREGKKGEGHYTTSVPSIQVLQWDHSQRVLFHPVLGTESSEVVHTMSPEVVPHAATDLQQSRKSSHEAVDPRHSHKVGGSTVSRPSSR